MSDEEKEVYSRMTHAIDSQDYVSAIEDGIELIQKFPGSRRASEAADRILDIYLSVSNRTEEKFRHVHESVVREMLKVDAARHRALGEQCLCPAKLSDALTLPKKAYTKYDGQPESTKCLCSREKPRWRPVSTRRRRQFRKACSSSKRHGRSGRGHVPPRSAAVPRQKIFAGRRVFRTPACAERKQRLRIPRALLAVARAAEDRHGEVRGVRGTADHQISAVLLRTSRQGRVERQSACKLANKPVVGQNGIALARKRTAGVGASHYVAESRLV